MNQTLLAGNVLTNRSKRPLAEGVHSYAVGRGEWIYHSRVGYVFGPGTEVTLTAGSQTGAWSEIGTGSSKSVTLPVFNLGINHGYSPPAAKYQYTVVPGASLKQVSALARKPIIDVLSNREDIQAVWKSDLEITMVVFRKPASVLTPIGWIGVDHSCLLLVRMVAGGWKITASNPENQPLTLHIEVGTKKAVIDLPGGNFGGSSVTLTLAAA